jgi:hypothetical protein
MSPLPARGKARGADARIGGEQVDDASAGRGQQRIDAVDRRKIGLDRLHLGAELFVS